MYHSSDKSVYSLKTTPIMMTPMMPMMIIIYKEKNNINHVEKNTEH